MNDQRQHYNLHYPLKLRKHTYSIYTKYISDSWLTLYYMGGHFVPAHVDDPSSLLGGCPKWPHISWLCLIHHSLGPIEAIFKNSFWNFEKPKKKEIYALWKKNQKLKKFWFFSKKPIYLHMNLNSTCSKLSFEVHNIGFAQNLEFCIF